MGGEVEQLQSCFPSLSLGYCRDVGEKGYEVLLIKNGRPFALMAAHLPVFGQDQHFAPFLWSQLCIPAGPVPTTAALLSQPRIYFTPRLSLLPKYVMIYESVQWEDHPQLPKHFFH